MLLRSSAVSVPEMVRLRGTSGTLALGLLAVMVGLSVLVVAARSAHAQTIIPFVVNSTGDARDANLTDSACDASASVSGNQCTLRAAIQEANDTAGADKIEFNIVSSASVKTISPTRPLPEIADPVSIDGYTQPGAKPNTLATGNNAVLKIQLNGTNSGTNADGLRLDDAGGSSTIRGLVINRFARFGVLIDWFSDGNKVSGNFIGTNAAGTADLGNGLDGVEVILAEHNTIGGTASEARNVISGNGRDGVVLHDGGFGCCGVGNKVLSNLIGTDKTGTRALGNDGHGVLNAGVINNAIERNTIAFNGGDGVRLPGGSEVDGPGVRIVSNSIFSNGELGIDLHIGGPTPNDPGDGDRGANNVQNFPEISSAKKTALGKIVAKGKLNSVPNEAYVLQFFSNPKGNEGKKLLGSKTIFTGPAGNASFTFSSNKVVEVGQNITATATRASTQDTSEFSTPRKVVAT